MAVGQEEVDDQHQELVRVVFLGLACERVMLVVCDHALCETQGVVNLRDGGTLSGSLAGVPPNHDVPSYKLETEIEKDGGRRRKRHTGEDGHCYKSLAVGDGEGVEVVADRVQAHITVAVSHVGGQGNSSEISCSLHSHEAAAEGCKY